MRNTVSTDQEPAAIGPYNQAIDTGDMVFLAGQTPIEPSTGKIEAEGVGAQTRRVLDNIGAVLEAASLSRGNVVKTTVYLQSMEDFKEMNAVYAEFFDEEPPARTTVEVAGLPMGALVEIEVIAKR